MVVRNLYGHLTIEEAWVANLIFIMGLNNRCGLAMLHKLAGANPAQVIASHEPGIEPCRHIGNGMLDA